MPSFYPRRHVSRWLGLVAFLFQQTSLWAAPPVNDAPGAAQVLTSGITVPGTTADATYGEEDVGPDGSDGNPAEPLSVWYHFHGVAGHYVLNLTTVVGENLRQAPTARVLRRDAEGRFQEVAQTAFASYVAPVAQRQARFAADPALEYYVMVSSSSYSPGPFSLTLQPMPQRALYDDYEEAGLLPAVGATVDLAKATRQPAEVIGRDPTTAYGQFQGTVWMRWTAPASGYYQAICSTPSGASGLTVFQGGTFPPAPIGLGTPGYDGRDYFYSFSPYNKTTFATAAGATIYLQVATNLDQTASLSIKPAVPGDHFDDPLAAGTATTWDKIIPHGELTIERGENTETSGTAWIRWTAPDDAMYELSVPRPTTSWSGSPVGLNPLMQVYRGDSLTALVLIPAVPLGIVTQPVRFRAVAGATYRIQAGLTAFGGWLVNFANIFGTVQMTPESFTISLRRLGAPPVNDDLARAGDLGQGEATATGTTVGAGPEAGESLPLYHAGDTVWHRWTAPPEGGKWELKTTDSSVPLRLARLSGTTFPLMIVEEDFQSPQRWTTEAGRLYHFRLCGNGYGTQGTYALALRQMHPPANDTPVAAITLSGSLPLADNGTTADASPEPFDANPGYSSRPWSTIWWKWQAPQTDWVQATANGAAVGVMENGQPMGYTFYASHSLLRFRAMAGRTYLIRLSAAPEQEGPVSLLLETASGLDHASAGTAVDLGTVSRLSTTPYTLTPGAAQASLTTALGAEIWYRWTAPFSGYFSMDSEGSVLPVRLRLWDNTDPSTRRLVAENAAYPTHFSDEYAAFRGGVLTPGTARLLTSVTAGSTYWLIATPAPSAYPTFTPGAVQVQIQPAGPPPAVDAIEINLPPRSSDSAERSRWMEVLVKITAPNGFSSGELIGIPRYQSDPPTGPVTGNYPFTDAQRISGDAYAGTYRVRGEVSTRFEMPASSYGISVSLADTKGGRFERFSQSPLPAISKWSDDASPPVLESVSGLPPIVTLTDGRQSLTMLFSITDRGGSGFTEGAVFYRPEASGSSQNRPGERRWPQAKITAAERLSGDALDGLYQITLLLPQHLPLGNAGLQYWIRDAAGNKAFFNPGNLTSSDYISQDLFLLPLPGTVVSETTADTTLPTVASLSTELLPATPAQPHGSIRSTWLIADALSGFASGQLELMDTNGVVENTLELTATHRFKGDPLDGRYACEIPVPAHGFAGRHHLRLTVRDASGLPATVLSGSILLPDRTTADQRLPRLSYLQISPPAVDLRQVSAALHISLGASDDRPGLTGLLRFFDSNGLLLASRTLSCVTPHLACDFDLTLPQRPYPGLGRFAIITLDLTDSAGRSESYGLPETTPWPAASPVSLSLQPGTPAPLTRWAAAFPGYQPQPQIPAWDSDRDGTPDLIEFALGTDPTLPTIASRSPSVSYPESISFFSPLGPPLPASIPYGADPRSPRLPILTYYYPNPASLDPTAASAATYTFTTSPIIGTLPWSNSRWRFRVQTTTDLTNWQDQYPSPGPDGKTTLTLPSDRPQRWFRLQLDQTP